MCNTTPETVERFIVFISSSWQSGHISSLKVTDILQNVTHNGLFSGELKTSVSYTRMDLEEKVNDRL